MIYQLSAQQRSVLQEHDLGHCVDALNDALTAAKRHHGDAAKWQAALDAIHWPASAITDLASDAPVIGDAAELDEDQRAILHQSLRDLMPWRKGPFQVHGIDLDSEWRCDMKWQRLQPHISPLAGRRVCDIGCGNGYYALRMLGDNARFVLGIDPSVLFCYQFRLLQRLLPATAAMVLPLQSEQVPENYWNTFDSVFSMGVLYHRASPITHCQELWRLLRPGGELILETLLIDEADHSVKGAGPNVLVPEGRYAQMRNVWFLPTASLLATWLRRVGFEDVACIDISPTSTAEQRSSPWMTFQSLGDFLDPSDPSKTVEGHPAPLRGVMVAKKPY